VSYLAIARKYRPATFADIVGQEHVVRTLQNALSSERVHHAYLFCGARGVGKTTAARALAKALNCERGPTPEPCGVCGSCVEIAAGRSPDLVEIDGASNNSVDDVRELRDTVNYAPQRGRFKVYLIDEVHMLSKAAFNALLKTLEEPPPHVVFIFATTEPNRILDTILSRVQRFDFKRIGVQPVADRLQRIAESEGAKVSPAALRMIARAGEGSMRDAQSLLDKVISSHSVPGGVGQGAPIDDAVVAETLGLVDRSLLLSFTEGMLRGEPDRCLEVIEKVYSYGYELSEFTTELLELVRNATFLRLSPGARAYVDASADELLRLEAMVEGIPPDVLTRLFNALLDVHDQVSRAARPRIVLEMAVARLATTRPVEPVSGLLARLEDLERKLRAPSQGAARAPNRSAPRDSRVAEPKKPASRKAEPKKPEIEFETLEIPEVPKLPEVPRLPEAPAASKAKPKATRQKKTSAPPPQDDPQDPGIFSSVPDRSAEPSQLQSLADRWKGLAAELKAAEAGRLVEAQVSLRQRILVLSLPAGRALAEGRRARSIPQVEGLIRRAFPQVETIVVEPSAGTGSPAEHQRALQRQALDHPELRRIVQKLGAELEAVIELREESVEESTLGAAPEGGPRADV
jgi:DNA polymerase-3 subunit gamma/tau